MQFRPAADRDPAPLHAERRTELAQRDFGMVARARGFGDRAFAIGVQPREQHAGLHLRAGYRQRVIDGPQPAALNFERRKLAIARADGRAHFPQRLHDALHGPRGKRFVAENARGERLRRQDPRQHADGGPGIARVQIAHGPAQSIQAAAVDDELRARARHFDAERAHAAERRVAVGAGRVIGDARGPFGDGRDHGVAVRNGLIAG